MERIQLTEQDLLEALTAGCDGDGPAGALTVFELAERMGHSQRWVREQLRRLDGQGRLEVLWAPRRMLDGRPCRTPVYRLKGAAPEVTR